MIAYELFLIAIYKTQHYCKSLTLIYKPLYCNKLFFFLESWLLQNCYFKLTK